MKTETPWIIRSLNASNCNGSPTDCVKEMLESLKDVLDMCAPIDGNPDSRASVIKARAAIAKAEAKD